jgi:hypothetical protein
MKFRGGEYEQRGVLIRRHVTALVPQFIGKEVDHIESEFVGEDVGPQEHPLAPKDQANLLAFVTDVQKRYEISDRDLIRKAHVSHHTLEGLRERKAVSNKSLAQLARAIEALRREAEATETEDARWLGVLRDLVEKESTNKVAKRLRVSAPYIGRVLKGEKPMTQHVISRIRAYLRDK